MSALYKLSEWDTPADMTYVNDISKTGKVGAQWWVPARVLGISPSEFLLLLIEDYDATISKYVPETGQVIYGWKKENKAKCRKFKNYVNKVAREKQFMC